MRLGSFMLEADDRYEGRRRLLIVASPRAPKPARKQLRSINTCCCRWQGFPVSLRSRLHRISFRSSRTGARAKLGHLRTASSRQLWLRFFDSQL